MKRIFKMICKWKGFILLQWHVGEEHVHLYVIIPPKFSISYVVQVLKGKSSSWIKKKTKKLPRGSIWCRGYFVSTIGINEHQIINYIKNQDKHRMEVQSLFDQTK
jgi:putative transposase